VKSGFCFKKDLIYSIIQFCLFSKVSTEPINDLIQLVSSKLLFLCLNINDKAADKPHS
jgi:hypothetical protein